MCWDTLECHAVRLKELFFAGLEWLGVAYQSRAEEFRGSQESGNRAWRFFSGSLNVYP
jgi:hypothetical protein